MSFDCKSEYLVPVAVAVSVYTREGTLQRNARERWNSKSNVKLEEKKRKEKEEANEEYGNAETQVESSKWVG